MSTDTKTTAAEIRRKRARAKTLSKKLAQHEPDAQERAKLWRELRDEGVSTATLAADSGVSDVAVRKACRTVQG